MPKFVLHYFDFKGRGEPIRLMFHCAGVEFEDRRFQGAEWPEIKKDGNLIPFGQVPVLQVDDAVIAQTYAILSYLADEFGMNGKNNLEKAKVNMLIFGLEDLFMKMVAYFREKDEDKKAAMKKEFYEVQLPAGLQVYEDKFVPEEGFFLGDSVSLADVVLTAAIRQYEDIHPFTPGSLPKVMALRERVENMPNIKKYLDSKK